MEASRGSGAEKALRCSFLKTVKTFFLWFHLCDLRNNGNSGQSRDNKSHSDKDLPAEALWGKKVLHAPHFRRQATRK